MEVRAQHYAGARAQPPASLDLSAFAAPHDVLGAAGLELAHYRFGRGPALLFVHGWPLHAATFRALVPLLAEHYTCHLLDLPGAGHSRVPAQGALDVATFTRAVRGAADSLDLGRYALVAHDSGGGVARMVAADDPRVAALVLGPTEIPHHHPWLIRALQGALRLPGGQQQLLRGLAWAPVRHSGIGFGAVFRDPALADGDFFRAFIAPLLRDAQRAASTFEVLKRFDMRSFDSLVDVHARIAAPTLLVWGDDDPYFPLDKARAMVGQFRGGAELHVIPGGRTFVHEEEPARFAAATLEFLARTLAPS
jgi:haloalkane dehalogenase